MRIGLLGGSFNPAHGGHLHISLIALQRLDLDAVWWLVSPQNPLKPKAGMAPLATRLAEAREVAAPYRRIRISDIERRLGTRYTVDTLAALHRQFPHHRFVWLMGGDNLRQIREWRRWDEIFRTTPVAVVARPAYSLRVLSELAPLRFARSRIPSTRARRLADMDPPAWTFFHARLDHRSATRIRSERASRENELPLDVLSSEFNRDVPPLALVHTDTPPALFADATAPLSRPPAAAGSLLDIVLGVLDDGKAEEVVTIDLAGKTDIADHMVIATGRSSRQVVALTDHIEQALAGRLRVSIEGKAQGDWVLIDAGDLIVHLFRPEVRTYYNLEKMWGVAFPGAEDEAGFENTTEPAALLQ